MTKDKKVKEPKPLSDDQLNRVAGGILSDEDDCSYEGDDRCFWREDYKDRAQK